LQTLSCYSDKLLEETDFQGAILSGAFLANTDLRTAKNLTAEQLSKVRSLFQVKIDAKLQEEIDKEYPGVLKPLVTEDQLVNRLRSTLSKEDQLTPNSETSIIEYENTQLKARLYNLLNPQEASDPRVIYEDSYNKLEQARSDSGSLSGWLTLVILNSSIQEGEVVLLQKGDELYLSYDRVLHLKFIDKRSADYEPKRDNSYHIIIERQMKPVIIPCPKS
jgi:hypothetical protein